MGEANNGFNAKTRGISRRNFLMGAGALSLGAASLGLSGCGSAQPKGGGGSEAVLVDYSGTVSWDAEYDVVVVGFGGAGAVSSISAADEGAKVLLLEKAPLGDEGGNTRYCEQAILWFDDYDGGIEFMKSMTAGFETATDEIIDYMVRGSIDNKDWLLSIGADAVGSPKTAQEYGFSLEGEFGNWLSDDASSFAEYPERIMPGGNHAHVVNVGGESDNGRKLYWKLVRENVVDRKDSIDVWFEAPALELIQDPFTKTVLGVKARRDGRDINVRARNGVVLSCGSYEASSDKYENYAGLPAAYPMGSLYNTGDGIDMAIAVGANLWHMAALSGPWLAPKYSDQDRTYFLGMSQRFTNSGNCIYVGGDGTRFVAESGWQKHGHIKYSGTWKSQICPDVMYAVFDQTGMDSGGKGPTTIDSSLIVSADTIEELAEKIAIDSSALRDTVTRYNGYVDAGKDEQFDRHPDTLAKVETAPYYAVRLYPGCVNCQGGPRRNVECEVLDMSGDPIPHLYSAGELGSFWTDVYDGGGNIAETMYTGRTAGRNAAMLKDELVPVEVKTVDSELKEFGNDITEDVTHDVSLGENEYVGVGQGLHGDIKVKVKVDSGKVAAVEVLEQHETDGITDEVWVNMPDMMVSEGVAEVDTVSGATIASNGLIDAVNDALSQAE